MNATAASRHNLRPSGMPDPYASTAALAAELYGEQARHAMIAEAAYFRALRRGFVPGHELDDWLAAEAQVDTALTIGVLQ
jgi:hypothetical protein